MTQVSVIIPTCNRARFLPTAVDSARAAAANPQIIVVDDGSTDETAAICRSLPDIEYLRLPSNRGLAAARNAGIRASSGDFIAFVDDDDLRLPGSIDLQVAALAQTDAALCYGRVLLADAKNRLPTGEILPLKCPSGDIFWDLLEGLFLTPVSVLAHREALFAANLFDERLALSEDWDFWIRIAETRTIIAVHQPVAIYRQSASGSEQLGSNVPELMRQMLTVQQAALRRPRALTATSWQRRQARRRLLKFAYDSLRAHACDAMAINDFATAQASATEAMRLRPLRGRGDLTLRGVLGQCRGQEQKHRSRL